MKTFQLSLTAMLLLGLTTAAFAQLPIDRLTQTMYYYWHVENPNFMMAGLLQDDTFREGIGVSEEQVQKIQDAMGNTDRLILQNDPRLKPFQDKLNEFPNPFVFSADTPKLPFPRIFRNWSLQGVAF